jgi:hypothetical protein
LLRAAGAPDGLTYRSRAQQERALQAAAAAAHSETSPESSNASEDGEKREDGRQDTIEETIRSQATWPARLFRVPKPPSYLTKVRWCRKPSMTITWTTMNNAWESYILPYHVPYSNPNIYARYRARRRHRDLEPLGPSIPLPITLPYSSNGYTRMSDCLPLFVLYLPLLPHF